MSFWIQLHQTLSSAGKAMLLYVLESEGSSPGRQGFRMFVGADGNMQGSVGGGIMEHKLIELAKDKLTLGRSAPIFKKQIHQTNIAKDKSGMICSGEQAIGIYYLDQNDLPVLQNIIDKQAANASGCLMFNQVGMFVLENITTNKGKAFEMQSEDAWSYMERIAARPTVYIIGGGHVGMALSQTMHQLDFFVEIFDHRENLNTMQRNNFAHKQHVVPFDRLRPLIKEGPDSYIVVMSFGYKTDKAILQHLEGIDVRYFGMMGSQAKVDKLYQELLAEGFSKEALAYIHSPIGVQIASKTPAEIAISVAAEIIKVKNFKAL